VSRHDNVTESCILTRLALLALAAAVTTTLPLAAGDGVITHRVESPFQRATTTVRVLARQPESGAERARVVYVLPVEPQDEHRYGDGLEEIKRLALHLRWPTIFVAPSFADLPWYADHPTEAHLRQESHLLKVVLPLVEKSYPVRGDAQARLLLGFSKSGWGAWSLLLRHPEVFARAAAWDAPLMLDHPGPYGSGPIFGTADNFRRYEVGPLVRQRADLLRCQPRLILAGHQAFAADHRGAHELLDELRVPHLFLEGPARKHDWHSGWVAAAVEALLADPPR
jgi:hypothetical protein